MGQGARSTGQRGVCGRQVFDSTTLRTSRSEQLVERVPTSYKCHTGEVDGAIGSGRADRTAALQQIRPLGRYLSGVKTSRR
jgi:hypothetical protein